MIDDIKITDFINEPLNDTDINKFFEDNNIEFDLESIKIKCYEKLKSVQQVHESNVSINQK